MEIKKGRYFLIPAFLRVSPDLQLSNSLIEDIMKIFDLEPIVTVEKIKWHQEVEY
jgi:hypothetical protein